jgi:hypothetical protein
VFLSLAHFLHLLIFGGKTTLSELKPSLFLKRIFSAEGCPRPLSARGASGYRQ